VKRSVNSSLHFSRGWDYDFGPVLGLGRFCRRFILNFSLIDFLTAFLSRSSSCVWAFHFSPAPFGHWSVLIDLRTRLRIDYRQSRTPLQIPNQR
jgi:hypothetical protein